MPIGIRIHVKPMGDVLGNINLINVGLYVTSNRVETPSITFAIAGIA